LPHAIADGFAAPKLNLLAVGGEILLHLDDQFGIRQAHPIPYGGAVVADVLATGNL